MLADHTRTAEPDWRRIRRHQRLPRPLPPFPDETITSYLQRLQHAHGLASDRRGANLGISPGDDVATVLSELTGRSATALEHALPELRHRPKTAQHAVPYRLGERARQRLACRHCALSRGAGEHVQIWMTHEQVVCHRHRRWLGDHDTPGDQLNITACPDIPTASRRHRNLIARLGRDATEHAYQAARDICWKWFQQGYRFDSPTSRLDALLDGRPTCTYHEPHPTAALYPTVIALTAILASPFWLRRALSESPDDAELFLQRVTAEVTDGYRPRGGNDPLRVWLAGPARTLASEGSPGAAGTLAVESLAAREVRHRREE